MNKKDRIAIVISVLALILSFAPPTNGDFFMILSLLIWVCVPVYWGYRFIKNDISFLNIKEK